MTSRPLFCLSFLLSLPLSAQTVAESVTELQEIVIEGKAESLLGIATSASKGQTNAKELM